MYIYSFESNFLPTHVRLLTLTHMRHILTMSKLSMFGNKFITVSLPFQSTPTTKSISGDRYQTTPLNFHDNVENIQPILNHIWLFDFAPPISPLSAFTACTARTAVQVRYWFSFSIHPIASSLVSKKVCNRSVWASSQATL